MQYYDEPFQHPFMGCRHTFDLSNFIVFANYLSDKLCLTIELEDKANDDLPTINHSNAKEKGKLIKKNSMLVSSMKFELLLEDCQLYFHEDLIEIVTSIEIDYHHLLFLNQNDELKKISLFSTLFDILRAINVQEILVLIFDEIGNEDYFYLCYQNVVNETLKGKKHFIIKP